MKLGLIKIQWGVANTQHPALSNLPYYANDWPNYQVLLDRQDREQLRPGVGLPLLAPERHRPPEPLPEGHLLPVQEQQHLQWNEQELTFPRRAIFQRNKVLTIYEQCFRYFIVGQRLKHTGWANASVAETCEVMGSNPARFVFFSFPLSPHAHNKSVECPKSGPSSGFQAVLLGAKQA